MLQKFLILCCGLLPGLLSAQVRLQLKDFASGFTRPVDIAHCGDSRLFVVEQKGLIWVVDSTGKRSTVPFLDIDDRVINSGNERGLLGLAFHPNFKQNGWFFVNYIKNDGSTRIARFTVSATDPNKADPASELNILEQSQPYNNHNGGCTKFGPDGFLYLSLGDGGSGGDPQDNGQKKGTLLGKMLRIDVNNSSVAAPYKVPETNPFVGNSAFRPEIWSWGWRNVWRFSFDRLTSDIWLGDVGQSKFEEIDFEPRNTPGLNYGWRCYEGRATFNTAGCQAQTTYVGPVFEYANPSVGCSVTGGFVYRGKQHLALYGKYIFADYCSGIFWSTERKANGTFETKELANLSNNEYSTFGENRDGELFVATLVSGKIQRVTDQCSDFTLKISKMFNPVCNNTASGAVFLTPQPTAQPVKYQWSDNTTLDNIIYLNPGVYTVTATDGNNCVRVESFEIKSLEALKPALAADGKKVLCANDSVRIQLSDTFSDATTTFEWEYNGTPLAATSSSNLWVKKAGTYRIRAISPLCKSLWSNVLDIDQEINLNPLITTSKDTLRTAAGATAYQWFLDDVLIAGANGPEWVAKKSGQYKVQTTSINGCNTVSLPLFFEISSVQMPASVQLFSLAPNPAYDQVQMKLELAGPERISISLTDAQGRQIFQQSHTLQRIQLPINLSGLPSGTYYLHVELESGRFTRPLVRL